MTCRARTATHLQRIAYSRACPVGFNVRDLVLGNAGLLQYRPVQCLLCVRVRDGQ